MDLSSSTVCHKITSSVLRRLTFVTTAAASYFLLTADYGSQPNALDPILRNGTKQVSWACIPVWQNCEP
ncbi:hypothetical protein GLYMA_07G072000v4 [Glycine max]|uniref:Uncharacterized protein n=2 Tax=Glycine subgen. Soja TaxID=1462606 RepID=A0A0R0J0H9_SOYBN|nr:hypothetical protein GYH30_017662 [Glycine max]KRH48160.1 hypothetical protein GLYMA_07G072000v4 [Glycine max]RZC01827.1 hypothetical protein D0Y65_017152 [Glycine soja]